MSERDQARHVMDAILQVLPDADGAGPAGNHLERGTSAKGAGDAEEAAALMLESPAPLHESSAATDADGAGDRRATPDGGVRADAQRLSPASGPESVGVRLIDGELRYSAAFLDRHLYAVPDGRKEKTTMEDIDRAELVAYFEKRRDSVGAMRSYWAGRIDGHCLQNAIDLSELTLLAHEEGFPLNWKSALEVVSA